MSDDLPICEWRINDKDFMKDGKIFHTFSDGKTEEMVRCPVCKRTQPLSLGACDFCEDMRREQFEIDRERDMNDNMLYENDEEEE